MKAYWQQLNEREQGLVIFAGMCCLFYLLYIGFMSLNSAVQDQFEQLEDKKSTLQWMAEVRKESSQLKTRKVLSSHQFLSILSKRLDTAPFHRFSYQLEQSTSGNIELKFDTVPYNQWMTWLWSIQQEYAVSIEQMIIDQTAVAGVVKLRVTLKTL